MKRFFLLLFVFCFVDAINAQQWVIEYLTEGYEEVSLLYGDKSLKYDYVVGRYENIQEDVVYPIALCIDENGEYLDKVFYLDGEASVFSSVLGLGDGNIFVTAACGENNGSGLYNKLWVAILNPNLEIVTENYVELEDPYSSFSEGAWTLVNDNEEIVAVTLVTISDSMHANVTYDYSFYKFDMLCNLVKHTYLENPSKQNFIDDFIQVPDMSMYAMFGNGMHVSGMSNVVYIDDDLNYLSMSFLDEQMEYPNLLLPFRMSVDYWYDESHFLMSAQTVQTNGVNGWKPFVAKMDTGMNVMKILDLERIDTVDYVAQYNSMAYVNSDVVYVSTFWERSSYSNNYPNTMTIYLINDDVELLGRKTMYFNDYFYVLHIHSTFDEGCIVQGVVLDDGHSRSRIYKFEKDDFEIITDVLDYNSDLKVSCCPNPVSSSLNINVSSIRDAKAHLILFDANGRRYLDKDVELDGNVLTLNVAALPEGIYFYKIVVDNVYEIKEKFIKK